MIDMEVVELDEDRRPYAPTANVLAVIDRVRRRNLPDAIDTDFLRVTGVSEGAIGRGLFALRFLRLIDNGGRPTDRLRAIARAPEEEYRDLLAAVVREAYAPDFARIDPSQDPQPRIISQFQRYEPRSQRERMVILFLGLCRAAGIPVLDAPRKRGMHVVRARPDSGVHQLPARIGQVDRSRGRRSMPASAPPVANQLDPIQGSNLLFGVTVEDIGELAPDEFDNVWSALGVLARARARSMKALKETSEQAARRRAAEEDEAPGESNSVGADGDTDK